MDNTHTLNRNLEAIGWGALLIWWGTTALVKFLPEGSGIAGIGLILLCLNAARYLKGIAINGFTATLGILALVWGCLELAGAFLNLPFELPIFAILLMVLGVTVIAHELAGSKIQ
jgi:hypothetical protein